MWALALRIGAWLLGYFFPAKDERDVERQAGEQLGTAKAAQAAAEGQLKDVEAAQSARDNARMSPGDILRDPNNAGPGSQPSNP